MWTAPWLQDLKASESDRLRSYVRSVDAVMMTAAEMGSATRGPNRLAASSAAGWLGVSRVLDRSITHIFRPASSGIGREDEERPHAPNFGSVSLFDREPFLRPDRITVRAPRADAVKDRGTRPRNAAPKASLRAASTAPGFRGRMVHAAWLSSVLRWLLKACAFFGL
jgi:hypothetical protein